jgi:hypothetical protein
MKLYVETEKIKGERITTFLKKCYNLYPNSYNIVFTRTYFDKLFQNKQCKKGNRSFEDIYAVIKTYYPNCTKKHFANQLEKIIKNSNIKFLFCPDIQKWVLMNTYQGSSISNYKYLYDYNSSRLKLNKKGQGEYTYFDIMSLMGYSKIQCKIQ